MDAARKSKERRMRYDPDLAKASLESYLGLLKRQNLLPSKRLLLDGADGRFARIRAQGIASVSQLLKALATPAKIESFAEKSGVPASYLVMLRREAATLRPKPVALAAFPGTDQAEIDALAQQGIKTSKDYFERAQHTDGELYALCDLSRINGVGPSAARMFYAAGFRSARAIAGADAEALLARVKAANETKRYYAGKLGEKDMRFCIDLAKMLMKFAL